jgi:hypothetical protein
MEGPEAITLDTLDFILKSERKTSSLVKLQADFFERAILYEPIQPQPVLSSPATTTARCTRL